ncbi:16S rRNA (adenine(1518)-N(6)/adenine(1519)-N(6))-dimethyltransferase RsmA [Thermodesulfobacteriota bacterium]
MNRNFSTRPIKKLGQHFLVDGDIIRRIIKKASLSPQHSVLEIGPGRGALTIPLAKSVKQLYAVEKDQRLADLLSEKLSDAGINNVTIFNEDILKWDFHKMGPDPHSKVLVIGNLPYNISSPVLDKLVKNRLIISKAVLMFQQEVAQRLTAVPSEKAYGALTLLIQYHAFCRPLINVNKKAFYPVPKVDSTVLEIDFERPYPKRASSEDEFRTIVKGAFAHRRKKLSNSLLKSLSLDDGQRKINEALEKCGIDPSRRAETLSMDEFICLTESIVLTGQASFN